MKYVITSGDMESVPEGAIQAEVALVKLLEGRLRIETDEFLVGFNGDTLNQTGLELDDVAHDLVNKCAQALNKELLERDWSISRLHTMMRVLTLQSLMNFQCF